MAASTETQSERTTSCYVYGIVPADVAVTKDARGVGDPPGEITLVRHGKIAALVSEIRADQSLGRPEDLQAHEQLLDACAATVPVLPIRFGAAMTDPDAVATELLSAHEDEFARALDELDGHAQYTVRGRYQEDAVLREILAGNERARQLREQVEGQPEDASRDARIALGELVNRDVDAKRQEDTRRVVRALEPIAKAVQVREPTHELDAMHVSVLAETAKERDVERALDELAREWADRVRIRLLGPLAPYDFVVTTQETKT